MGLIFFNNLVPLFWTEAEAIIDLRAYNIECSKSPHFCQQQVHAAASDAQTEVARIQDAHLKLLPGSTSQDVLCTNPYPVPYNQMQGLLGKAKKPHFLLVFCLVSQQLHTFLSAPRDSRRAWNLQRPLTSNRPKPTLSSTAMRFCCQCNLF